jgi:hypothetical protein
MGNESASMMCGVLVFAVLQAPAPLPTIEVKVPADVTAVEAISDTLGTLSQKVTACVEGGKPVEKCRCSYPKELGSLRGKYDELMKQHPGWKDQLVSYQYVNKEGRNISGTLVLQNLRRQLEPLKCD